jgi:hypothetical protein
VADIGDFINGCRHGKLAVSQSRYFRLPAFSGNAKNSGVS